MTVSDIFNLANSYSAEGNNEMAGNLWTKCTQMDPLFGPAYINLGNLHGATGNKKMQMECLEKFLNCPVTGNTVDIIPKVKAEIDNIKKQLNPQPQPVK